MGAFEIVAVIYLLGILINLRITLIVLKGFRQWKEETQFALFAKRPGFKSYLIRKIFLWPLYFITEKSPLRRLSESFFSHYGDPGHTYFGTLGLENFLNDLLKGKNRYKHCDIKHLFWPIDGESSIRTDFRKDKNEELFINIYYMQWKGNYRLIRHLTPYRPPKQLSRFELDRCYLVSQEQFQKELFEVNALKAQALFEELFSKTQ